MSVGTLSVLVETVCTSAGLHVLIHFASEGERMREHETGDTPCWCGPEVRMICPECDGAREAEGGAPACWRCGGDGMLPCENPAMYDGPHGLMIVHRDVPG